MAKTNYRVNTTMGLVTRTSARTYAFVVLARGTRHDIIDKQAADTKKYNLRTITEGAKAAAGDPDAIKAEKAEWNFMRDMTDAQVATYYVEQHDRLQAELDGLAAKVTQQKADSDAALLQPRNEKDGEWSSRLDLARSVARKQSAWYREVRIFDVATGAEVI